MFVQRTVVQRPHYIVSMVTWLIHDMYRIYNHRVPWAWLVRCKCNVLVFEVVGVFIFINRIHKRTEVLGIMKRYSSV